MQQLLLEAAVPVRAACGQLLPSLSVLHRACLGTLHMPQQRNGTKAGQEHQQEPQYMCDMPGAGPIHSQDLARLFHPLDAAGEVLP